MKQTMNLDAAYGPDLTGLQRITQKEGSGTQSNPFPDLQEGQHITGVITSVGDPLTIDFGGYEIAASKDMLCDARPMDEKTFEVIKNDGKIIELRLWDPEAVKPEQGKKTICQITIDNEGFLAQKDYAERRLKKKNEIQDISVKIDEMTKSLTIENIKEIEREGFPAKDLTIEQLYTAMKRMKDLPDPSDARKEDQKERSDGKDITPYIAAALQMSESAARMDDKTMSYLIQTDQPPTIENIYKAYYSGRSDQQAYGITDAAWEELSAQAKDVIISSGYEVNAENLDTARWILDQGLPLTKKSFAYKKELEEVKGSYNKEDVLNRILKGAREGTLPREVSLLSGTPYDTLMKDMDQISDDAIEEAVKSASEITIRTLIHHQTIKNLPDVPDQNGKESVTEPDAIKNIQVRRQLEEIRLKMTKDAAAKLEKKGIRIDTEPLEKVVEELKEMEELHYKQILKATDLEATKQNLQIMKDTSASVAKLKYIPSAVLGRTMEIRKQQTIAGLLSEGNKLTQEFVKVGKSYETLMTVPSSEYGDSLSKAFENADSMLTGLNLSHTKMNQRAVRILGYNQMEITKEAIENVKSYDLAVTTLIEHLNPAVTVRLMKEGVNPLQMPISELNKTVEKLMEEQGVTSEEKFSTYLRKLEKSGGITEEERASYIGIYRLLYQIEKSDGAAIGAVIKADQEVTLSHLLTAIRSKKADGMSVAVNDAFGSLEQMDASRNSITDQINAAFVQSESVSEDIAEQSEFIKRMIKQMKDNASPEQLSVLQKDNSNLASQREGFNLHNSSLTFEPRGIWESIKDVTVENLYDQMQDLKELSQDLDVEYDTKLKGLKQMMKNSDQAVRFLEEFKMPATAANIMLANQLLSNGETHIKRVLKQKNENIVDNLENDLKEIETLSDKLTDKDSINKIYEKLEESAKEALGQAMAADKIDSERLAQLKSISTQMTFLKRLAEKEFYQIPIQTANGVTNMNLTIIRDRQAAGKVSVSIQSEQLGNTRADFILKNQNVTGFIHSDSSNGMEVLKKMSEELNHAMLEEGIQVKQMEFGLQFKRNDLSLNQEAQGVTGKESINPDAQRVLYKIARTTVQMVQKSEQLIADGKKIAS